MIAVTRAIITLLTPAVDQLSVVRSADTSGSRSERQLVERDSLKPIAIITRIGIYRKTRKARR
jgi:hypothetical protein